MSFSVCAVHSPLEEVSWPAEPICGLSLGEACIQALVAGLIRYQLEPSGSALQAKVFLE